MAREAGIAAARGCGQTPGADLMQNYRQREHVGRATGTGLSTAKFRRGIRQARGWDLVATGNAPQRGQQSQIQKLQLITVGTRAS